MNPSYARAILATTAAWWFPRRQGTRPETSPPKPHIQKPHVERRTP